jgi:DNA-binding FrmR family transcriptional regulator
MRNKNLVQNRLRTLEGQLKTLDMQIHRGGSRTSINEAQRLATEILQDIIDIIEREA